MWNDIEFVKKRCDELATYLQHLNDTYSKDYNEREGVIFMSGFTLWSMYSLQWSVLARKELMQLAGIK